MSIQKVSQWVKDNGALAFLLGTQMVAIIGVFAWLAVSSLQSLEQPGQNTEVFAKHLPVTPATVDSQTVGAQPAASEVK